MRQGEPLLEDRRELDQQLGMGTVALVANGAVIFNLCMSNAGRIQSFGLVGVEINESVCGTVMRLGRRLKLYNCVLRPPSRCWRSAAVVSFFLQSWKPLNGDFPNPRSTNDYSEFI